MKLNDWVVAANPPTTVSYDIRNPPSTDVIATIHYAGPRLDVCGNPALELKSSGVAVTFLAYSFDASTRSLLITLPNTAAAVKGVFNLDAVFSLPGVYTWSLGVILTVYDICDASVFKSAPVLAQS